MLAPMGASSYSDIKVSLRSLYLEDPRPWLVGFSGGKDSTMLASLIVEVVAGIPEDQRTKPVAILSTDTRVEIPAIVEMVGGNSIELLTTEEVWAYLLQKPNPWGGDNRPLYKLYASASNGECPIQIDTSTPSCGNSRFGCWTCTVVDRDKASEGLLASGDERMEKLIEFRETLLEFRDPANGWRDKRRMNGNDGPGPLTIEARRELLKRLLALQEETHVEVISPEELLLIQQMWKAARDPDDGRGVARIVNKQRGIIMSANLRELNRLRELEEEVAREKAIDPDTLRRMVAKVEEYSESHRAHGLPDALLNILKDDLEAQSTAQKA
jgi:DNA sulfur modification protein DndC